MLAATTGLGEGLKLEILLSPALKWKTRKADFLLLSDNFSLMMCVVNEEVLQCGQNTSITHNSPQPFCFSKLKKQQPIHVYEFSSHCTSSTATARQIPRTTPTFVTSQSSTLAEQPWKDHKTAPCNPTEPQHKTYNRPSCIQIANCNHNHRENWRLNQISSREGLDIKG